MFRQEGLKLMDNMVAKLDGLYPKLRYNKACSICGRQATEIHHIIHRDNLLLRYDLNNLLPLCSDCHRLVHDKGAELYISVWKMEYLNALKNVQLKDYLLKHGLTKKEFFKLKEIELRREINEQYI